MHNHHDGHCAHEVIHCPVCDVVYCAKCGREWGVKQSWMYPMYPVPYTVPSLTPPYIVTCGPTGTGANTNIGVTTHNHAVTESLDKSICDNADVWQELANGRRLSHAPVVAQSVGENDSHSRRE